MIVIVNSIVFVDGVEYKMMFSCSHSFYLMTHLITIMYIYNFCIELKVVKLW